MKTLLTLLLVIPLFSWGQVYQKFPENDSSYLGLVPMPYIIPCCINIDSIFKARHVKILKATHVELININQKPKWYSISKNDLWVMGMEVGAGYSQGWREQVLYHPIKLFEQFPNLNRKFWDARWSWQNGNAYKWDANHVLKGTTMAFHLAAVVIKAGDIKNYPKKHRWKKILFDAAKYYISYQIGFALSYNLTHGNKLF